MSQEAERANYVFFWKADEPEGGYMSQWWDERPFSSADGSVQYRTTEHYMMSEKAVLFGDDEMRTKILATADPRKVRELGRQVKDFKDAVWQASRSRIVEEGNALKFRQLDDLRRKLLDTGDRILVEASPRDRIWGIGYGAQSALSHKEKWGLNLLGQALMNVRASVRAEEELSQGSQAEVEIPSVAGDPQAPASTETAPPAVS
ncbi:DUF1768-domain-containing protein [Auricularia subglabra TFB-10046 SS5]|nr:DUF1768-domain-containing protein [Auricularia subglabra TFB-10046 SS5]